MRKRVWYCMTQTQRQNLRLTSCSRRLHLRSDHLPPYSGIRLSDRPSRELECSILTITDNLNSLLQKIDIMSNKNLAINKILIPHQDKKKKNGYLDVTLLYSRL